MNLEFDIFPASFDIPFMLPLPKFLLAENSDDDASPFYVVHTEAPRFIARYSTVVHLNPKTELPADAKPDPSDFDDVLEVTWLDGPVAHRTEPVRALMRAASAYLARAFDD